MVLLLTIGCYSMRSTIPKDMEKTFQNSIESQPEVVTEEDLAGLPAPVQKYLRYTQIIGKEKIHTVRLKQKGVIRTKQDGKWMPYEAEQFYTVNPPSFVWNATVKSSPFLWIKGRDRYHKGKGNMLIKLLSLIKIIDATGDEMDQGSMVRYFNEMFWFPTAYLSDYIKWEPIDSRSAKATMSYQGATASAVFHFNEKGQIINFVAKRYMENDGRFELETWSTPIDGYKEINGIKIPISGKAVWNLSSGDFNYIKLEITDIVYNNFKDGK